MKHGLKPTTFGARLKWLREKHQLTLAEFGAQVGVGRSYLSKLENGKSKNTSEQFLYSVCTTFNVERDWLLTGGGNPFTLDHLNEAAEKGELPPPYHAKLSNERALFIDACFAAGVALELNPDIKGIAQTLSRLIDGRSYPEPLRLEIARILLTELVAQISLCSEIKSVSGGPVSDLGKLAIAASKAVREQSKRQDTTVGIQAEAVQTAKIEKFSLTESETCLKPVDVKAQLPNLRDRLKKVTQESGQKSALAKFLGVPLASVSRWLSGDREPGGEIALKLLHWVEQQERQQ